MKLIRYIRTLFLSCLIVGVAACAIDKQPAKRNFSLGVDYSRNRGPEGEGFFSKPVIDSLGVDFIIYHYSPKGSVDEEIDRINAMEREASDIGVGLLLNLESANWNLNITSTDGFEYVAQPDSLHLFKFPGKALKNFNFGGALWGFQYDEIEHCQINRNLSIMVEHRDKSLASLADPTGMTFLQADSAVCAGTHALVEDYKSNGAKYVLGEHVWPVLFHNFARAGMTPVYKQMKENWSNVFAACAAGASMQYNQELWACLDFWLFNIHPGHSADELWNNLLFAYWFGVDKAYVESTSAFYDKGDPTYTLNERAQAFMRFSNEYLPSHPRPYTFRDYEPEIAIIRFDDTEWGQGPETFVSTGLEDGPEKYFWPDQLFGAKDLRTSAESEEWLKAWSIITHGVVKEGSISWNAENVYGGMEYQCFAPMNAPVVYDQTVNRKQLKGVKLAFLCGLTISQQTLDDVAALVEQEGLTVVTSSRYAPADVKEDYVGGTRIVSAGKGRWIVTDNMTSLEVQQAVRPLLGNDHEIVLKYKGGRRVVFTIDESGKTFSKIDVRL